MPYEYKHKVDLSQFKDVPFPEEWEATLTHYQSCGHWYACDKNKNHLVRMSPKILAYARELEARVARMQEAGDNLMEMLRAYTKNEEYIIEAWRNA